MLGPKNSEGIESSSLAIGNKSSYEVKLKMTSYGDVDNERANSKSNERKDINKKKIKIKSKSNPKNKSNEYAVKLNISETPSGSSFQTLSLIQPKDYRNNEGVGSTPNNSAGIDKSIPEQRLKNALLAMKMRNFKKPQTSGKTYMTGDTTNIINSDQTGKIK